MLRAADVWFSYDDAAVLRGINLDLPSGSLVGVLGPNGSGKTTLLRVLAGTRRPQRGAVTVDGIPLAMLSRGQLARRMAVVPQETHVTFDYTVAEVAMMGRYAHLKPFEIEGPADVAVVEAALASTGTQHLKDRPFATLSGGEKQRVVIATALAQIFRRKGEDVGYLLLDEPTASLDLGYQLEVAALLKRLHDERSVTILVSTHDLALAGSLCDRLILLHAGEVIADGSAEEALTPANVRRMYGVDVEVIRHPSGRRLLVPLGRAGTGSS